MQDNQLQVILTEQNVGQENAKKLIEAFGAPFTEAGEILHKVKTQDLKVTDGSQTDRMAEAREMRLTLKRIRTGVETKRKELKEDALKTGRAIDTVARYVKDNIQPAEEYLQLQEDFIKIEADKRRALLIESRVAILQKYVERADLYKFEDLTDDDFDRLIADLKKQKFEREEEARIAAEKEKAAAEAERKRQAEIEAENERYKKEAEEKKRVEQQRVSERSKQLEGIGIRENEIIFGFRISGLDLLMSTDKEWEALFNQAKERIQMDKDLKAKQALEEAELQKERDARAKLEREKREKEEADARAKADADAAEKAALLAPDKDKLLAYAKSLGKLPVPMLETKEAQDIMNKARDYVNTVAGKMIEKANTL